MSALPMPAQPALGRAEAASTAGKAEQARIAVRWGNMLALFEGMKRKRSIGQRSPRRVRRGQTRACPRWLALPLMVAAAALPMACGSGMANSKAPSPAPAPANKPVPMATVSQAATAFDQAEQDLQAQLLSPGPDQPSFPQPNASPPGPTPPLPYNPSGVPPKSPGPAPMMNTGEDDRAAELAVSRCTNACRALASMKRSADRLCELAGDDNDRCINVRERVESAARLVLSMCPECKS